MPSTRWSRRLASSMPARYALSSSVDGERRAVHPLQLAVALVAAPVGARERQHLERLDVAGALDVRPAAQVDEVAVLEERDRLALGDRLDDLDLVDLAARAEQLQRLGAADHLLLEAQVLGDDLAHLRLDALRVLGGERLGVEVVIEPGFDRRTDRDLGVRTQPLHGVRHDVRRRMPHARQRIVGHVALVPRTNHLPFAHIATDTRTNRTPHPAPSTGHRSQTMSAREPHLGNNSRARAEHATSRSPVGG